jgi:hypothetical protein
VSTKANREEREHHAELKHDAEISDESNDAEPVTDGGEAPAKRRRRRGGRNRARKSKDELMSIATGDAPPSNESDANR